MSALAAESVLELSDVDSNASEMVWHDTTQALCAIYIGQIVEQLCFGLFFRCNDTEITCNVYSI